MRPLPNEDEKINRHETGAKVFSSLMKSCSKFFRSCFIFCPFQLFLTGARLSIHSDFLIRTSARDGEVSQQQQQRNRSFPDYFLLFKTIFFLGLARFGVGHWSETVAPIPNAEKVRSKISAFNCFHSFDAYAVTESLTQKRSGASCILLDVHSFDDSQRLNKEREKEGERG